MLSIDHLSISLGNFALRDICLDVREGEYLVLLGWSGVGKTVLLETLVGILAPDAGCILLDGREITCEKIQNRRLGLVHQDRMLFPHLTVRDNIAYSLRCRRVRPSLLGEKISSLAGDVGISHLLPRKPSTLSGGEAQRVALARTLAIEPRCLLLDEPLASLDIEAKADLRALLRTLNRRGQTIVHVTHDYEEAISLASRIAVLEHGRVAQAGDPRDIFSHPQSEFVARFMGIQNVLKGILRPSSGGEKDLAEFVSAGPTFFILTPSGYGPGFLLLRSEDLTLANSRAETSARNTFQGTVTDLAPGRGGVEVTVDIGVELTARITFGSAESLGLRCGKRVWVTFKASAGKFIGE